MGELDGAGESNGENWDNCNRTTIKKNPLKFKNVSIDLTSVNHLHHKVDCESHHLKCAMKNEGRILEPESSVKVI